MTREMAQDAFERLAQWERDAQDNLFRSLAARGACEPIGLTLHNWGACAGREPYATLCREMNFRQRKIWDRYREMSAKLGKHLRGY